MIQLASTDFPFDNNLNSYHPSWFCCCHDLVYLPKVILFCRDKEIKMHNNIREVVVCVLNLAIVLLVAYSNRASESYQMFKSFDNIFNEGLTEKSLTSTRQAFHKVSNIFEPPRGKTNNLHRRKQRRRSASR